MIIQIKEDYYHELRIKIIYHNLKKYNEGTQQSIKYTKSHQLKKTIP